MPPASRQRSTSRTPGLTLSNSEITDIQAQYDYRTALVRLRRAMGLSVIPDATGK